MVFSSIIFVMWFLPLVLLLYFILPKIIPVKNKIVICNGVLLISSLIFYAWDTPKFLGIMLVSIFINYFFGIVMGLTLNNQMKKIELIISVVANLSLLGYFKYFNFFIDIFN